MEDIGIGILGFGTVGAGVVEAIDRHQHLIGHRTNVNLVVRGIADLDIERDRGLRVDPAIMTTEASKVIENPDVQIVVETIGGTSVAKDLILKALDAGKPVVTANKALLAEHGKELFDAAGRNNVDFMYEASVAGGIPVLAALRKGLVGNHVNAIYGILNGTCNYILTEMEHADLSFDRALEMAQEKGFAEVDPTLDVDGFDTAHKACVLGALAYGYTVDINDLHIQGIRDIEPVDIHTARDLGYRIKLLAIIEYRNGKTEMSVSPALVPVEHMLASVDGENNAVMIDGDIVGETLYYGKGAGRLPTGSAVLADISEVAVNLAHNAASRLPALVVHDHYGPLRHFDEVSVRYYIRMNLINNPGVLAKVAGILGRNGISIASVIQKESVVGEAVPVIFLTQEACEKDFKKALGEIADLDVVGDKTVCYRIANLDS